MRILVIRHGQSQADILNVHEGRADFELTPIGLSQAKQMVVWVAKRYQVDTIITSPLKRALQTAECLANQLNLSFSTDELLLEFNNGLIAGLSRKEAQARYPYVPDLPPDKALYGQESKHAFRHRADKVLGKVLSSYHQDATIVLISHGGLINQLYHAFLSLPIDSPVIFHTGDTGIHEWRIEGESRRVVMANSLQHLTILNNKIP
ncbi:MAG: histidine phosphatase family protein [Christensenellales bacterium]|jgi:2,3-bisphosphoglycerate-dependent phosphoglycerate mutase